MPRIKRGVIGARRRKKYLKEAKGFFGGRSRLVKTAIEAVEKSWVYSYAGRKQRKRDFRSLWIVRIGAACKELGLNYSTFIHGLKEANVQLNRKSLSELAINDKKGFNELVEKVKNIS